MQKIIKVLIAIVLIICLICIICVVYLKMLGNERTTDNQEIVEVQDPLNPDGDVEINYEIEKVKNATRFYTVQNCIQSYLDNDTFTAKKMESLGGERIIQYRVYGFADINGEKQYLYFKVKTDTENLTFEVTPYEGEEYKALEDIKLTEDNAEIKINGDNVYTYEEISQEEMSRRYLQYYYSLELNDIEEAYSLIDEEYRNQRFESLEDYREYVEINKEMFSQAILTGYSVENNNGYTQYVLRDSYSNYYVLKEDGIMDFTILLDTYTVKDDNYLQAYNKLDESEKTSANVELFIQMINTRDYKHAYNTLSDGFKTNYFPTLEQFKEYVLNNFYYYNIATINSTRNEGNIYIYEVTLKDGVSTAAETKNKSFNIRLGEGTDFEISFNVE